LIILITARPPAANVLDSVAAFHPLQTLAHSIKTPAMFVRMVLIAVAAAICVFAIRYGIPHLFGTANDVTVFDATIRALLILLVLVGLGWWWSRRERI
jgi:hypothetical protein